MVLWAFKSWGWVGGWVELDYSVSSGPFFEFWISYWTWTTHLSLVHQILIEGLLPAQLADRGLLHQLESFEHWLKLIEAHTSAWKLLQYLSLALDLVSQPWADSITFYLWVKLKLWQVYFRLYQTNKISFQKVSFTFCKYSFFPNSWNRRATKSNNVKFSKVQIQIVGEREKCS